MVVPTGKVVVVGPGIVVATANVVPAGIVAAAGAIGPQVVPLITTLADGIIGELNIASFGNVIDSVANIAVH